MSDTSIHSISGGEPRTVSSSSLSTTLRSDQQSFSVPSWQPDLDSDHCAICGQHFTFFIRRHHCRMCGRIVCNDCSTTFTTYLPHTYVVSPPSQIYLESPHVPHRTCDECANELEMIRQALSHTTMELQTQQASNNDDVSIDQRSISTDIHVKNRTDDNLCPICSKKLAGLSEKEKESHITECIKTEEFSGLPQSKRRSNRMLVYTIPREANMKALKLNEDNECIICFENFKPNDKIARFECLCCFHYKCIMDWISHKGRCECPIHTIYDQQQQQ